MWPQFSLCSTYKHAYLCTSDCLQVTWHESQYYYYYYYYYYYRIWDPISIPLEHSLSAMADSQHWLLLIMWLTTYCHKCDLFFVNHACGWHLFANYTVSSTCFLHVLNHFWRVFQLHILLKYLFDLIFWLKNVQDVIIFISPYCFHFFYG